MSSKDLAIQVRELSKCYEVYEAPKDRLKQFVLPRLTAFIGRQSKHYFREFWALRGVSFSVEAGETVGIIGRNGSGKSTLLQLICGTLHPTQGNVEVNGRVAALLELGAGFNSEFSGRENVYLNASLLGLTVAETEAQFANIEAFAEIGDFIDQPVRTYSSGMFVRLAFAIAVHVKPDVLIVDEALSVGDIAFQNRCIKRIQSLKEAGTSILFVSHDQSMVQILCDRVVWMENGKVRAIGTAVDVCQDYYADSLGLSVSQVEPQEVTLIPQQLTGMARFVDLRMKDSAGTECSSFKVGESLTIDFALLAEKDLANCVFTISIYRSDGDWSIGQTSVEQKTLWPPAKAGECLSGQLILQPLSLAPADYKICLSAFSSDLKACYAMTDLTTVFSVRASYQTWGKFIHPCRWVISE